ncbi:MAG: glycosyltransferase 87 family protein [Sporichthyaceae bacterium]|nr:glycosyltransferase 87 family protein [Sporichthyaceae bacterium]
MDSARRLVLAALGLVGVALATVATLRAGEPNQSPWRVLGLTGLMWLGFAVSCVLVQRVPPRTAVPLVLAGGIALQALAASVPPRTTDDFYRYAWDGRVQAAGIDPYRYPPTAPELAGLRDGWLFPAGVPLLNHPTEPTIYPPAAQAYFRTVDELAPAGARHKPWQVAAAVLAVATTAALAAFLWRRGGDPRRAVLWAWCPTVILEAGNNGHVDVLAALLVTAGLGTLAATDGRGREAPAVAGAVLGGALLGAATAVKLLPALVLAALTPRRYLPALASAAGVVCLLYLPHLLAVGTDVVGFLPGYLAEQGYNGSGRFALLRLVLPRPLAPYAAAVVLAAVAATVWRRPDPIRPWRGPLLLTGTAFLVLTPSYPWYALLLVALVALDGRWEWLAVAAGGYVAYFAGPLGITHVTMQAIGYGLALAVVATPLLRQLVDGYRRSASVRRS